MTDSKTQIHGKFTPPNIEGLWVLTREYGIIDDNPDVEITLDDIIRFPDNNIRIKQRGEFITWEFLETNDIVPTLRNRLGVWKPTLINGTPLTWELLLSDWDDSSIGFIQVLETDDCDIPVKLFANFVESFTGTDSVQAQTVARATLIKKNIKNEY